MSWRIKAFVAMVAFFLFINMGLSPLLSPLLYTFTPLQRYYLGTYMASSWHADEPEARTEVRWIWKVRPAPPSPQAEPRPEPKRKGKHGAAAQTPEPPPKLQYDIAEERDLVPKPLLDTVWNGNALPFVLSEEAEREGWTGLEKGHPYRTASGKLTADMRQVFFDGDPWRQFFVQPALALGILVFAWLACRAWMESERKRNPWGRPLRMHEFLWQRLLELPGRVRYRVIEAVVSPALPPPSPAATAAPPPSPAAAPPPRAQAAPQEAAAEPQAVFVWDESKGID